MLLKKHTVQESTLFTYVIASAEMRYGTVNERVVFLRNDPRTGPIVRGEICDLGSECYANLSQVLLEYAMSCEGCRDQDKAPELVECLGERLGTVLAKKLYRTTRDLLVIDLVCVAFEIILQSIDCQVQMDKKVNSICYDLTCCPLIETAQKTGIFRGIVTARRGFIAICTSMLHTLAPEWNMIHPTTSQADDPLVEIVLQYQT